MPNGTRKDLGPVQKHLIELHKQDPSATVEDLARRMGRSIPVTRNIIRRLNELHGITIRVQGGPF
jgi:Mn-dependent DtxR family transcriptional regulator